jgi:hypothetical protein
MHTQAYDWLKKTRQRISYGAPVLEIGSIDINGSARELWGNLSPYVGVDIVAGKNVDYVVDFSDWNVINNRATHDGLKHDFRTIICTEVLEHVDPKRIIAAMYPYMADECAVVITAASIKRKPHSADGAPELKPDEYYKNVTPTLLHTLLHEYPIYLRLEECDVILNEDHTDVYAFARYVRVL